jgi:hypothetical protein
MFFKTQRLTLNYLQFKISSIALKVNEFNF